MDITEILNDAGYSNYTVEGTTADCLIGQNPDLPQDRFYGEEPALLYAVKCERFIPGESVKIDCDHEDGALLNYSDDPEIKALLHERYS